MRTLLVATVLLTLGLAAAAPATTGSAERFTGKGVGDVHLGDTFRALRDAGSSGRSSRAASWPARTTARRS